MFYIYFNIKKIIYIEGDIFYINEIDPLFLAIPFLELATKGKVFLNSFFVYIKKNFLKKY